MTSGSKNGEKGKNKTRDGNVDEGAGTQEQTGLHVWKKTGTEKMRERDEMKLTDIKTQDQGTDHKR